LEKGILQVENQELRFQVTEVPSDFFGEKKVEKLLTQ
jgi:hypothetical protein